MFKFRTDHTSAGWNPPSVRTRVNLPRPRDDYDIPKSLADKIVQDILDREQPALQAFCQEMRQQAHLSDTRFMRQQRSFNQVVMSYTLNSGQEIIQLDVYPEFPLAASNPPQMVVFHSGNKLTVIPMQEVEGFTATTEFTVTLETTLAQSGWESSLLRCCQMRLSDSLSTLLLTPLIIDRGRVVKSETHHLVRADGTDASHVAFLATSTPSNRTPFFNGSGTECFVARDKFSVGNRGLQYDGLDGVNEDVSAIAADGTRYYKPNIWAWRGFQIQPTDAFEVAALGFTATDAELAAYEAEWSAVSAGNHAIMEVPFMFNMDGAQEPAGMWSVNRDAPWQYLGAMIYQNGQKTFVINDFYLDNSPTGFSGYGVAVSNTYSTNYAFASYTDEDDAGSWTFVTPDISIDMPVSVFSQSEGLDALTVELVPVTANVSNSGYDDGFTQYEVYESSVTFLGYTYTQHYDEGLGDLGSTPTYPPFPAEEIHGSQAWFVTFPPALNLDPGGYYFADTGMLKTPYGEWPYTQAASGLVKHPLAMHSVYKPWLHLSNGKVMLQGFEIDGERLAFIWPAADAQGNRLDPINAVTALERATQVTMDQIQAIWLDVPLKVVKSLG